MCEDRARGRQNAGGDERNREVAAEVVLVNPRLDREYDAHASSEEGDDLVLPLEEGRCYARVFLVQDAASTVGFHGWILARGSREASARNCADSSRRSRTARRRTD